MTTSRARRVSPPTSCSSAGRNCCPQELILSSALRRLPPSSLLDRYHSTNISSTSLPFAVPPGLFRHSSKEFRNASQRRPTATVSINRWLRAGTSFSYDLSPECFSSFQLFAAQGISWSDVVNCSLRKKGIVELTVAPLVYWLVCAGFSLKQSMPKAALIYAGWLQTPGDQLPADTGYMTRTRICSASFYRAWSVGFLRFSKVLFWCKT